MAANAASRGIELSSYRLELEADFDLSGFLGIDKDQEPGALEVRVQVELDAPGSTREELEDLVAIVEAFSPIRDTLTRSVNVRTWLA